MHKALIISLSDTNELLAFNIHLFLFRVISFSLFILLTLKYIIGKIIKCLSE